ncbi:hypothetical protein GGE65_007953 [Skermanella aerolata]|uniref:hypothetical protein n=1 Tax=Skermanella aerolata TaxID=393310 RepID=UPI003D23B8A4
MVGHSAEMKNAGESPHFCFGGSVVGEIGLDSVLDVALELVGELIDATDDLEMIPADDLPHSPLAGFQVIHPALQASNVGFDLHDVGVHPLDRREYQIALIHHVTAPETVMSLYAIHRIDAIKE